MLGFASLEARYLGLETGYNNLIKLYERLKQGSIQQALSLVERIRLEDEVPDMAKDNGPSAGSTDQTPSITPSQWIIKGPRITTRRLRSSIKADDLTTIGSGDYVCLQFTVDRFFRPKPA